MQQHAGKNTLNDHRIANGDKCDRLLSLDHMEMRRIVIAVVDGDFDFSLLLSEIVGISFDPLRKV